MKLRNLLMTVMLLAVVALMFVNIVNGSSGLRSNIESHGSAANQSISSLSP